MPVTTARRHGQHRRPQRSVTVLVGAFVTLGIVVATALAVSTGAAARHAAAQESGRSFQRLTVVVADAVVAPLLTPDLLAGGPAATARMRRAVDRVRASAPILTVTVRDGEGRVVWTDDDGATATALRPDQQTALRTGSVVLDPFPTSDSSPDPFRASVGVPTSGAPLLVVVTAGRGDLVAATRAAWRVHAPVALGSILLLELLQLPLVLLLARQVRRHQRAEATLREAAGAATAVERRRIVREVHDDVLPALHGLLYELDAARLSSTHQDGTAALLDRTAEGVRSGIRRLRALLLDLNRDRLPEVGLIAALAEMTEKVEATGVRVSVHAPDVSRLPRAAAEVLFRCVQETLRNVAAHSGAEHVDIDVVMDNTTERDGDVTMTIEDDGRGFEGTRLAERGTDGHVGLKALGDLVADSGGSLTASSSPGQGTRIIVRMPLRGVGDDMRVQR